MQTDELTPPRHFDLCIIGSGSGNTIVDERFSELDVALIDRGVGDNAAFGGTCLNVGCIPTKMFVVPADYALVPGEAAPLGVRMGPATADFSAIRDRIFARIDPIAENGLHWRQSNPNVTVYRGAARFVNPTTLRVGGEIITADQFVLAAGSRPHLPPIEGLDDPYLANLIHTSETIMRVDAVPKRLVIVGGGVEAAEFGHIFAAFGSKVTIINRSPRLLRREDDEIAEAFTGQLAARVALKLNQHVTLIEAGPEGGLVLIAFDTDRMQYTYSADAVLICTGRVPNSDSLRVDRAGVEVDALGFVQVDEHQRTSVEHIWALGDICAPIMQKHVANHQARVVQHNLLHPDDLVEADLRFVPTTVFSHPEVASVGPTERELEASGADFVVGRCRYADVAYGWALEDTENLAKVLVDRGSGLVLGAHIIGPQACSILQPVTQALHFPVPARDLARGQYWAHPGLPEVLENALLDAVAKLDD